MTHSKDEKRKRARELASEFLAQGDPTGWFEALYKEGEEGKSIVPWADGVVNPFLMQFWPHRPGKREARNALVVGCGPGDDAEQLAKWGYKTTAFDVSETAIRMAKKRVPKTVVQYQVANLFAPPGKWSLRFDFVFEANTIQALPVEVRSQAIEKIAGFVKPGGKLLVIARGREPNEPLGQMPWPLTKLEIDGFLRAGLVEKSFENFLDDEDPPSRRFRALYERELEKPKK